MGVPEKARAADFNELMDFLERVYAEYGGKEPRFERRAPDLYQATDEAMGDIFILREAGRIVSSAGLFPMRLKLWGRPFTIQGVGGVGTLPEFRGRGFMNQVLSAVNDERQRRGGPFSYLAGYRRRYGVWGYEKAGSVLAANLHRRNLGALAPYGFKVSELSFDSIPWSRVTVLRDVSPACGGDAPPEVLKLKYGRPSLRFFMAEREDAACFAAISTGEMIVADWMGSLEGLADIANAILPDLNSLSVRIPLDGSVRPDLILPLAEERSIGIAGSLAVVDLPAGLRLLCANPALGRQFFDGVSACFVMEAGPNPEQSARLSVENGVLNVESGLSGSGATVIKLSPLKMAALLFGPLKPSHLLGEDVPSWLDALLPLPVMIPRIYGV